MAAIALINDTHLTLTDRFDELAALLGQMDQLEGEPHGSPALREAIENELAAAISSTREKVDKTAYMISAWEAAEEHADAEIARLIARRERIAKQRERLEGYVISVLMAKGVERFDGFTSSLAVRENPPAVVINGEVPADYMRVPVIKLPAAQPDKRLIKAALENGIPVAGCRLSSTLRLVRS